jgi:diguanylate cyclase (GGDEF)-like protein/PAS domain S-box-containing protein
MNAQSEKINFLDLSHEELSLLVSLGERLVSELNLASVLTLVAETACYVIQAETLVVPIIDSGQQTFTYRAANGEYAALMLNQTFPIHEGACGWVMQNQRPLLFGQGGRYELRADARWQPGMASSLLVPLICRGNIIGGLSALGKRGGGAFNPRDLTVLTLFANQASIAIDNARLFSELDEEKMLAQVTLASIGDAVITTDATGRVNFLNSVAVALTGWSAEEAIGRPAAEIFHIVNESSRECVGGPVDEVIKNGKQINLANHTVLIARDGTEYNIEDSAAPIVSHEGTMQGCVLVFHDITDKHHAKRQMEWLAVHDALTGLPNRILLADRFQRALANAKRQNNLVGVCMLDLDLFKPVNDSHGHDIGDQLLKQVAVRLNQAARSVDTIARLGGDEFVLLLCDFTHMQELEDALQRILDSISATYFIGRHDIDISASIGVAVYPLDDADADTLLRHADQAMYLAKQAGRNRIHWFDVAHDRQAQESHQMLSRVREALQNNELTLYYQPKLNMRSGEVVGMEALLRWVHPKKGLVPPMDFLPQVEQSDLIVDIGEWVIDEALRQSAQWSATGYVWPISVNIAARHFQLPDFYARLKSALERHPDVPPQHLDIEIVESVALKDVDQVSRLIQDCQSLGVSFSLDDFGTGYSSLSYLKRLHADTLKIDKSFVRDILDDNEDLAVVEAVIGLATVFNRKLVAEGVETPEHGALLMRLGCDVAQGYGIARPMPAAQVVDWAAAFKPHTLWNLWAGTQWELSDLPLLVAQYDHLEWIKHVIMSVEDAPLRLSPDELKDHHMCRFGQWYYSYGQARYGHLVEFSAIEPIHIQVHQVGQEIVRLHATGEIEASRALCPTLMVLKDRILAILSALHVAVLQMGK